ncbi:hypothetical protein [Mangrovibacillus cuniculi]|uniref:Uncharacterized protein n=1 Tax=Mangrovibacillus cuniculi TaxID=2593652 RepID=A0A7S8CCR4_9BACI|nr:hypothetical protein [Mangrovibacillus cuniculi]QPC47590.1 hypothetical protein G8O30_11820 [Mangrovibacillus cuniculi]
MKRNVKQFLLSSIFIIPFIWFTIWKSPISAMEDIKELLLYSGFFFPIFIGVVYVIPILYIKMIVRNDENRKMKTHTYLILSWLLFYALLLAAKPVGLELREAIYFQGDEATFKQELYEKVEYSIEERLGKEYTFQRVEDNSGGALGDIRLTILFKEENCNCTNEEEWVNVSYTDEGWKLKIINLDLWYLGRE